MISKRYVNQYVRKGEMEKIENYDKAVADKTQMWECHHRFELTLDGEFAHSFKDLKRMGMYYNRPYFELIFVTRAEHNILHGRDKWNTNSDKTKTKRKISKSNKGIGFKKYWSEHKDPSLPDQRTDNRTYMNLYMKKYRQRKVGYLTFRRELRLGLIPDDSSYDEWVKLYVPGKKHPWLK